MTAPLYQHVPANSVAPRIKTLAADWQVWEFAEGATDIEYDGEYGSERVWIVSGRETSPSLPSSRRCRAHLVTPVIVGGEPDRIRDPLRTSGQRDDVIGGVSYDDGVDFRQAPLLGVFDVTTGAS